MDKLNWVFLLTDKLIFNFERFRVQKKFLIIKSLILNNGVIFKKQVFSLNSFKNILINLLSYPHKILLLEYLSSQIWHALKFFMIMAVV